MALLTQSYKTFLPQTNNQLRTSSNARNQATIQDGRVVVQNVQGRQNRGQGMNPRSGGAAGYGGVQNRVENVNPGQARPAQENEVALDAEQLLFLAGGQDNAFDDDVDEQPAPTAQTMFMANLSSADPVTDEAGPSYDSDILSEVRDHDHYQDAVCAHHEEYAMHDSVQLNHVVYSHADYTSDSNMIPYDQYVKDNEVPIVHSDVSSVPNDAFMMIYNDMCEPHAQSVSNPSRNTVVKNLLTAELATYKEQVELPNPYYNELNKVAIGYKNSLCLTRAKKVQPTLYNGHEIIKDNHVPAIVHNTEDTLEIAEITRKKMNDKIKDPECVTRKRITPTGLTEGERGFEQTEECYLKEVNPFFKTLKDNFEGIQKALTKEIKEMKDVFEELEAEVAQNVVDRKYDAIERKNLLIANDNLIAECLSKEVFSVAINFELNVARFTKMHVASTLVEARCLALEAELANLRNKSHHDNQEELINHFSKLEVNHLDLQLKYQNLKDNFGNNPPTSDKDTLDFDSVFVIDKMNNKDAHLGYLRHLKESVETIRDIVEEAKVKTNVPVPPSTRVKRCTNASGSQPKSNTKKNRVSPAKGVNKLPVEEQSRTNKSVLRTSNRVDSKDFQLGIKSYQTQLNLTKPRWDAMSFEYKHDYTVIDSPRAVTFRDRYGVQLMMRFNEIHKFSDGTLQQIDEALDYRVKEFKINMMNPGLNTRDGDYRLLKRTE
nr:retrovirus-related Pol polyprotein from transposon TNT 1-94 [Tanacetum cinerariifolium]